MTFPRHPQPNGWTAKPPSERGGVDRQKANTYVHPEAPTSTLAQPLCPLPGSGLRCEGSTATQFYEQWTAGLRRTELVWHGLTILRVVPQPDLMARVLAHWPKGDSASFAISPVPPPSNVHSCHT